MKPIKKFVKKLLRLEPHSDVTPIDGLVHVGSTFHGYHIPINYFDTSSVCYCVGAGLDISLDVELVTRFGAQVFIFDPMPYAFDHFTELVDKTANNQSLTIIEAEHLYTYEINSKQLETITFIKTGLWDEKKQVKFYHPSNTDYAGHSIINLQNTNEYIEASVDTMAHCMKELNHHQVDLLKIEIEGSEYTVIDNVLKDKLDVKMILVEFDEFHHREGKNIATLRRIRQSTDQLIDAGYKLVHSLSYYKRTFIRNDVFNELQIKVKDNNCTSDIT